MTKAAILPNLKMQLKKVEDRFVMFERPTELKTHWTAHDFRVVETSIAAAKLFTNFKYNQATMKWVDAILKLKYDCEYGYIVTAENIEHESELYYHSFVLSLEEEVFVVLSDDYANLVYLKIN